MQALILAGGEGTRLRPLTSTMPKPIVPLVDRPFIAYMIEWLSDHGVEDVILACGFMADRLRAELGDGTTLGVRLRYLVEPKQRRAAGSFIYGEVFKHIRQQKDISIASSTMDLTVHQSEMPVKTETNKAA